MANWIIGAGSAQRRRVSALGVELWDMSRRPVIARQMGQPGVGNQEAKGVEAETGVEVAMADTVKGRKKRRRYMNLNRDIQKS